MVKAHTDLQIDVWPETADLEIALIAKQHSDASGLLMKLANFVGSKAENALEKLPDSIKETLESTTAAAMQRCYDAATTVTNSSYFPTTGMWANKAVASLSGALGGMGGLPTTLLELPFSVTTIFTAIQKVAARHGFDPEDPDVKLQCISVFGSGGPLTDDDAIELSYLTSRVAVNGTVVQALISRYAPNLALVLSQKLAVQMVPVLGALTGAGLNYTFITYFEEMADVKFKLLKMAQLHGPQRVNEMFRLQLTHKLIKSP